jgi:hypothetical protein
MNKMVSVNQAVIAALEDIGMDEWHQAPIVHRWCIDAAKQIAGKYDFKMQRCVKPLKNKRELDLPPGTHSVINVFTGVVGKDRNIGWSDGIYPNMSSFDPEFTYNNLDFGNGFSVLYGTDISAASTSVAGYSVINNKIVFDSDVTGISEYTIYTLNYQTDSQGFIMVSENHLEAISYYVKRMVAERSRFGANAMPQNDIQLFHQRWTQAKKKAQIKSNKMPQHEADMMSKIANNPLSGKVVNYHGDFPKYI